MTQASTDTPNAPEIDSHEFRTKRDCRNCRYVVSGTKFTGCSYHEIVLTPVIDADRNVVLLGCEDFTPKPK